MTLRMASLISKAVGAAGARVGFAASTPKLAHAMRSVRDAYNLSSLDQAVATVLLLHEDYRKAALAEIKRLMVIMTARLNEIAAKSKQKRSCQINFICIRSDGFPSGLTVIYGPCPTGKSGFLQKVCLFPGNRQIKSMMYGFLSSLKDRDTVKTVNH